MPKQKLNKKAPEASAVNVREWHVVAVVLAALVLVPGTQRDLMFRYQPCNTV